jgi:hypothetical protein
MEAKPPPPIVRAVACPCVSPNNESRVVFAEMAPGAGGGGVTFRTRPRKQGVYPVYPPLPPRWQVTDLSLVAAFLVWRDATPQEQIDAVPLCAANRRFAR